MKERVKERCFYCCSTFPLWLFFVCIVTLLCDVRSNDDGICKIASPVLCFLFYNCASGNNILYTTNQWPKEKRTNNSRLKIIQKTNDWATRTPQKTGMNNKTNDWATRTTQKTGRNNCNLIIYSSYCLCISSVL
jgi:hypothetical protein